MQRKTFYPNSFIVTLMFASDFGCFIGLCFMYSSKPYMIAGALPLLLAPLAVLYLFHVVIDLEERVIARFGIRLPLNEVELVESNPSTGQGLVIKNKSNNKQILLPHAFYKKTTIEEIKNTIERKTIRIGN